MSSTKLFDILLPAARTSESIFQSLSFGDETIIGCDYKLK